MSLPSLNSVGKEKERVEVLVKVSENITFELTFHEESDTNTGEWRTDMKSHVDPVLDSPGAGVDATHPDANDIHPTWS